MVKSILMESLPRWYDLHLQGNSIVVEIHPQMVPEVAGWINGYTNRRGNPTLFVGKPFDKKNPWGFAGGCRDTKPTISGWTATAFSLPFGGRKKAVYCSLNLSLLFLALAWPSIDIESSEQHQLLVISGLLTEEFLGGWAISVDISHELYCWIKKQKQSINTEINATMVRVWKELDGGKTVTRWGGVQRFQHKLAANGGVYFSVPGNAADLCPVINSLGDIHDIEDGTTVGYRLEPHNIDGPLQ